MATRVLKAESRSSGPLNGTSGRKTWRVTSKTRQAFTAWMFIAPAGMVIAVFVFWTLFESLRTSFTDDSGFGSAAWVGLENYGRLFTDVRFTNALGNTLVYSAVVVPVSIAIALGLALLLNRPLPFRGFFRVAVFMPFVTSLGISSMAWWAMLNPHAGIIPAWFEIVGLNLGNGIQDPALAMPFVMMVGVWRDVGFFMVMYLGGLQSIPKELKESAQIDGAGPWRSFWNLTWPLLSNTTMFVGIMALVFAFQAFDQIYIMTGGGPYFRTETLVLYIFTTAVERYELGYASAISWVLVLLVFAVSLIQVGYFSKKAVQY
ncbi:MAG: sugar ABC transporter permease [Propionibacteriaceae bacterium]|nr:sugar ABC transporter permease [Propionibacteriaceae bacterium]